MTLPDRELNVTLRDRTPKYLHSAPTVLLKVFEMPLYLFQGHHGMVLPLSPNPEPYP